MHKIKKILGIDRGEKYVGLAYVGEGTKIVMPIGNLMNDGGFFFSLGDIITRHSIKKIIVGYPSQNEEIQKKIDSFIAQIAMMISSDIEIEKFPEDYTSVEAGAVTGDFTKDSKLDTIAAMKILENYISLQS